MKGIFFCLTLFFICVQTKAQVDYSGNYGFQSRVYVDKNSPLKPKKDEVEQGKMGDLTLFKIDSGKYKFWLSVNRGWPNYHSGDIDGIMNIQAGKGVFNIKQEYTDSPCVIIFTFKKNYVEVEQNSSDADCGFGVGVYADGNYKKKSSRKLTNAGLVDLNTFFTKYTIITGKAFLFEDGTGATKKKQYFIKDDIVLATSDNDNYVYVEYISASGKFIYGWIKKSDIKEIK